MINIGKQYDQSSDWQQEKWIELLNLAKAAQCKFSSVRTVLDLGSGSGKRTKDVINYCPNVERILGLDSNQSMIATARATNHDPRITYVESDIEKPRFNDLDSFDLIISNYSINWIRDKEKVFSSLSRAIHSTTFFLIATTWQQSHFFSVINEKVLKYLKLPSSTPYPSHYLNVQQWAEMANQFGWRLSLYQQKQEPHFVPRGEEYLRHWFSASTGRAFYGRFFEDFERDFIKSLIETLDSQFTSVEKSGFWAFQEHTLLMCLERIS